MFGVARATLSTIHTREIAADDSDTHVNPKSIPGFVSGHGAGEVAGKLIPPNAANLNDPFFQRSPPKRRSDSKRRQGPKGEKRGRDEKGKKRAKRPDERETGRRDGRDEQMTRTRNEKCGRPPAVAGAGAGGGRVAGGGGGGEAERQGRGICVRMRRRARGDALATCQLRSGNNDRGSVQTLRSDSDLRRRAATMADRKKGTLGIRNKESAR